MKLRDIKSEHIRGFAEDRIYERGFDYCCSGYVRNLKYNETKDRISAKVMGTELYSCEIEIDSNMLNASCDCPYEGYPCKHLVATLLCFVNDKEKYLEYAKK